ncbi:MAG: TRAM domain-containing protein, partial [Gemmatimonadota bacterium]
GRRRRVPGPGADRMATGIRSEVRAIEPDARSEAEARLDLEITSIAAGGAGVGRDSEGRVVFVPRTAPGDRVRVRITAARKRWARAELVEIRHPGPGRREPPCPLYARCGGCALQHLEIDHQRRAKQTIIEDALRRIGGLEVEVPAISAAGREFEYRNRLTFTMRRTPGDVRMGYRERLDPASVLDVHDCPLAEEPVRKALREIRRHWGVNAERLPAGKDLKVTLRCADGGDTGLHVRGGTSGADGDPKAIASAVRSLTSYVHTCDDGARNVLAGSRRLADRWQGTRFELEPDSFLQVNRAVSRRMDRTLDDWVGPRSDRRIADLYAGVGARAIRWAREGARVTAVESDAESVLSGIRAAAAEGLHIEFRAERVESVPDSFADAEIIVVNPPRAGLTNAVANSLVAAPAPRRLAYVSCDPATLGRDLARLSPVWHPVEVRGFDAFPQTAHVETLVWLERKGSASYVDEGAR